MKMKLDVENLSFYYRYNNVIFKNVNFSLASGEILSILGPNGAGKSTLLNCLVGLLKPKTGKVQIDSIDLAKMSLNELSNKIGYVPQIHVPTFGFKVKEYIVMGRSPKIGMFSKPKKEDYKYANMAMDKMEITHLADKPYTEISGGERQKATIAKVLVQEPDLIILDEPTAYLDYGHQHRTIKLIKNLAEEGYSIVMTTHQPEHAFILDNYTGILDGKGNFKFGKTKDIITEKLLSDLYDIEIKMPFIEPLQKTIIFAV